MTTRRLAMALILLGFLLVLPSPVRAQSAIAGVVKDTSGAVLPGVSVEAASDILIEKTRSAVSDGAGQYRIVHLRPGTYVVTLAPSGLQTVKRHDIGTPLKVQGLSNAV